MAEAIRQENMMQEGADQKASSNRISTFLLFATVAAAPLPFGSTNPPAIAFWCIVLGIAAIAASPRGLRGSQFALLGLAAIVIAAYGLVLHEQLATNPWFATPDPLWRETSKALGMPIEPSVSIARNQPFFALGASLADMLALICSFIVCTDRNRARQLLKVVAWSGVAYAIYGIAAFLIDPTEILWREKPAYRDVLTSTFVNRNTAAVFFGSCAIVWLLFLCERIRRQFPGGSIHWKMVLSWLLSKVPRAVVVSFSMLFVCLAAMFMTGSRAGVVLSLMMLVIAFATFFYRDLPRRSGVFVVMAAGAAVGLVLLQVMGAGVSGRFDVQGLADEGRLETYRSTLRMIGDHPWFGTGLGTFALEVSRLPELGDIRVGGLGPRAQYATRACRRNGIAFCRIGPRRMDRGPRPAHSRHPFTRRRDRHCPNCSPLDCRFGASAFADRFFLANTWLCYRRICPCRRRPGPVIFQQKWADQLGGRRGACAAGQNG